MADMKTPAALQGKGGGMPAGRAWMFGIITGIVGLGVSFLLWKAGTGNTINYIVYAIVFLAGGFASGFLTKASKGTAIGAAVVAAAIMGGGYFALIKTLFAAI